VDHIFDLDDIAEHSVLKNFNCLSRFHCEKYEEDISAHMAKVSYLLHRNASCKKFNQIASLHNQLKTNADLAADFDDDVRIPGFSRGLH
jgi:hypothetical protein